MFSKPNDKSHETQDSLKYRSTEEEATYPLYCRELESLPVNYTSLMIALTPTDRSKSFRIVMWSNVLEASVICYVPGSFYVGIGSYVWLGQISSLSFSTLFKYQFYSYWLIFGSSTFRLFFAKCMHLCLITTKNASDYPSGLLRYTSM